VSQTVPRPGPTPRDVPNVVRVTPELFLPAARRLVSQGNADVESAANRLVESAPRHEIDLTMCFVTVEPKAGRRGPVVRQACLGVRGAGRTAMMFISEPPRQGEDTQAAFEERRACIGAVCEALAAEHGGAVRIAQSLPEPEEDWSQRAFLASGFISVGTLRYLRREASERRGRHAPARDAAWPPGVTVEPLAPAGKPRADLTEAQQRVIVEALDSTYADTLDCPELCGLRETPDVLDSHRRTGQFDPSLWWVARLHGKPRGCMLLNRCPDQRTVELVYLGLAPELRGAGLGARLLSMGIERVRQGHPAWSVTCAVDERNTPAMRLYESLGFAAFGRRVALVRAL
jgi:ribosomal protein S18 acetylase RimI-like enzyme